MGFHGTGSINLKITEQKPALAGVSATGLLFDEATNGVNSVRVSVSNAGQTNAIELEGTLDNVSWKSLGTFVGNGIVIFDTLAYDRVRATTSTYGGAPFDFAWKIESFPAASLIQDRNGDQLNINPDGSVNVVVAAGAGGIPINDFNEVAAVPANSLTTILTYTIPPTFQGNLFRVEVGGSNVASYELYINGTVEGRVRTWFSTPLTQVMEFSSGASGFKLTTGDTIEVKVIHTRPYVGDFEARLQVQLT